MSITTTFSPPMPLVDYDEQFPLVVTQCDTKPLMYPPEIYREHQWFWTSVAHWGIDAAAKKPDFLAHEGGAPSPADAKELNEIAASMDMWMFDGLHLTRLNLKLIDEANQRCRRWAGELPSRRYVAYHLNRLWRKLKAYEQASNIGKDASFTGSVDSNEAALSAPSSI
jgi:hypothetical protein